MPNLMEKSVAVIIGVLLCVRQSISPLYEQLRNSHRAQAVVDPGTVIKYLIQVGANAKCQSNISIKSSDRSFTLFRCMRCV